jgi:hypothetical protein
MKYIIAAAAVIVAFNVMQKVNGSNDTAFSLLGITKPAEAPQQPPLAPGVYGIKYVPQMLNDAYKNEMSFDRYYKGHTFDAVMAFKTANEQIIGSGYDVSFESADCQDVVDPATTSLIASWPAGQMARVTGVIETVSFNTLILTRCRIAPAAEAGS